MINIYFNNTDYNNVLIELYYKLSIDTKYVFVKINEQCNLKNICNLYNQLNNIYNNVNNIDIDNINIDNIINTCILIVKNYLFIFKPLQPLKTYCNKNIYKKSNKYDNNICGDLYSICNGNFFMIDSKCYSQKEKEQKIICKTYAQTYLYMNAYFKPLCYIYKNYELLYEKYFLMYINPCIPNIKYINYNDACENFKGNLTGFDFNTCIKTIDPKNIEIIHTLDKYDINQQNILRNNSKIFKQACCELNNKHIKCNDNNIKCNKIDELIIIIDNYKNSNRKSDNKILINACCQLKNNFSINNLPKKCKEIENFTFEYCSKYLNHQIINNKKEYNFRKRVKQPNSK